MKSATVSFGQALDPVDLHRSEEAATEAELFLAVGTSLTVHPINQTVAIAKNNGARIVILNAEATPYDSVADIVLQESISEVLPIIVRMANPDS